VVSERKDGGGGGELEVDQQQRRLGGVVEMAATARCSPSPGAALLGHAYTSRYCYVKADFAQVFLLCDI
jgi:hypothetical protein